MLFEQTRLPVINKKVRFLSYRLQVFFWLWLLLEAGAQATAKAILPLPPVMDCDRAERR
jgi:hypothetical protein